MRIDIKARSVFLCGLEFHLTRAWPDVGGCRAFPVMLFTGQVYEVETAWLFFLYWRKGVRLWRAFAGQPQWWQSAARRALVQEVWSKDSTPDESSSSMWMHSLWRGTQFVPVDIRETWLLCGNFCLWIYILWQSLPKLVSLHVLRSYKNNSAGSLMFFLIIFRMLSDK